MRENSIEKYLVDQVVKHGGLCWKFVSPGRRGVPDRIVIFQDAIFFVELKAPSGKLSPHQELIHGILKMMGFEVNVLNTKEKVKLWVELQASVLQKQQGSTINLFDAFSEYPRLKGVIKGISPFAKRGIITNISAPSSYDLSSINKALKHSRGCCCGRCEGKD